MRQLISHIPLTACALAAALLVSACGGGDATGPTAVIGSSGFAVDDYISGANVVCDANGNGASDAGEATATTDSDGFFKFATACASTLVATGGTNIDTKLPFVGKLLAPPGSTMVTPLTTLMAAGMTLDQISTALGLPAGTNVTTLDPARKVAGELQNADLFRKTLVVQQVLQKIAETLAALAGSTDVAAMYSQAAAAMATTLRTTPNLVVGGVVNEAAVFAVVKAAATRVNAPVNADSLAQVIAAALTAQANFILAAESAQEITDATKIQQASSAIQTFVTTNKAALASAPGEATAVLKDELLALVGDGVVTPPVVPPVAGTLLISFDEAEATPAITDTGTFGGTLPSLVTGPDGGSGKALKIVKPAGATNGGIFMPLVTAIPFTADRKTITARVYSSVAGAKILLKVEVSGSDFVELESSPTGLANTWQTVSWNLAGVSPAKAYKTIVILPDFGVAGSGQTYYFDDFALAPAAVTAEASCATATLQCIGFAESTIGVDSFGEAVGIVSDDPVAGASNKVLKITKLPPSVPASESGPQPWGGTTVFTSEGAKSIDRVGFATSKLVTLRSNSGAAEGTKITLKIENSLDPSKFLIAQAVTGAPNVWENLTFDFASPTNGVFDANVVYDKASILPAWSETPGTQPALTVSTNFFFDELKYEVAGSTPPPPPPSGTGTVVADFDTLVPVVRDTGDTGGIAIITATPPTGGGSGSALELLRTDATNYALSVLDATVPFTADRKTLSARVYSPTAGIPMKIKLEAGGPAVNTGDIAANEAVVVGWQTLTWTFNPDLTKTYNAIVLLPNIGTVDAGVKYYFDDFTLLPAAVVPPPTSTDTVVADFDTVVPVVRDTGDTGGIAITTTTPPTGGGSGSALELLRTNATNYALSVLDATVPFTADRKTLSARVYSPTAGIPMKIKLEAGGPAVNTGDIAANEAVVVGWQTLTWTFNPDLTKTYNAIVLLPNIGTVDAGVKYYFDDFKLLAAADGGGGGGTTPPGADMGSGGPQTLTVAGGDVKTGDGGNTMFVAGEGLFSVNYVGSAETFSPFNLAAWPNAKTANFTGITGVAGGDIGYFQDDVNLSNSSQKVDEGGFVAGTALAPLGVPNFFRYFVLKGPVSNDAFMGLYVNAPNNGTVNVSSFSKIKVKVWGPAPMFERTNFNPVLEVTLTGPKVEGCTTGSGGSEIAQNLTANLKNGAGGFYTLPLSGFTAKGLCGTDSVANVLAKLARVVVTVPGTSFNYTNLDGGNYATGVNLGPIGFTNN